MTSTLQSAREPNVSYRAHVLYIFSVCALVAGLIILGHPFPQSDDLFYTGAAINLSKGHGLVNPYLARYSTLYDTDYFFQYPPLYSYILSLWIKALGLGSLQLRLLHGLCYLGVFLAVPVLLSNLGARTIYTWSWLINLLYCGFILYYGLRPDSLGMAFFFLSLVFLTSDMHLNYFLGFLFSALALLTWPSLLFAIVCLGGSMMIHTAYERKKRMESLRKDAVVALVSLVSAGVLGFALLEWMIGGELVLFMRTLASHASFSREHYPSFLSHVASLDMRTLVRKVPLLCVALFLGIYSVRRALAKGQTLFEASYLVVGAFGACAAGLVFHGNQTDLATFLAIAGSIMAVSSLEDAKRPIVIRAALAIAILMNVIPVAAMPIRRTIDQTNVETARNAVKEFRKSNPVYLVDAIAARYVFKPPKGRSVGCFLDEPARRLSGEWR